VGAATETELKERKHRVEDASRRPGRASKRATAPAAAWRSSRRRAPVGELVESLDGRREDRRAHRATGPLEEPIRQIA
jgi:hypothetical protein